MTMTTTTMRLSFKFTAELQQREQRHVSYGLNLSDPSLHYFFSLFREIRKFGAISGFRQLPANNNNKKQCELSLLCFHGLARSSRIVQQRIGNRIETLSLATTKQSGRSGCDGYTFSQQQPLPRAIPHISRHQTAADAASARRIDTLPTN